MAGIIYILTNECMPGFVKIGTTTTSVEEEMRALYTDSIPFPFECFYAATVERLDLVEKKIYYVFGDHKVPTSRDFFRIDPNKIRSILELVAIEEVTPFIEMEMSQEMLDFSERRPPFRFSSAQIPLDAELQFGRDESITCRVISDKTVEFNGMPTSLGVLAADLLKERGWRSPRVQGALHWLYQGESLEERRQRIERQI